jgi:chaperonin GroES
MLQPCSNQVLIHPVDEGEQTLRGFILPQNAAPDPRNPHINGKVLAHGPGRRFTNGTLIPVEVRIGDIVKYDPYGHQDVDVEDLHCHLTRENNIIAIVKRA